MHKDILCLCSVDDTQSEPHCQHQNKAKHKIQDIKQAMNNTMDHVGCLARAWPLCAIFALMLFCHVPNSIGEIPLALQMGQIPDVSKFTHFQFWQEVPVGSHQKEKTEELTCWCHPDENVGIELTHMVLLTNSKQLVPCSNVQPATDPLCPNLREQPHANAPTPTLTSLPFNLETVRKMTTMTTMKTMEIHLK